MEYDEWKSRVERTFLDQTGLELDCRELPDLWDSDFSVRQVVAILCQLNDLDYDPEWIESEVLTGREKMLKLG